MSSVTVARARAARSYPRETAERGPRRQLVRRIALSEVNPSRPGRWRHRSLARQKRHALIQQTDGGDGSTRPAPRRLHLPSAWPARTRYKIPKYSCRCLHRSRYEAGPAESAPATQHPVCRQDCNLLDPIKARRDAADATAIASAAPRRQHLEYLLSCPRRRPAPAGLPRTASEPPTEAGGRQARGGRRRGILRAAGFRCAVVRGTCARAAADGDAATSRPAISAMHCG